MAARIILILALAGLVIGGLVAALWSAPRRDGAAQVLVSPKVGGPFELVDSEVHAVTDRDFAGKVFFVYFGFTFCPDACPTELQLLTAALDKVGDKAREVKILFVTVDPERDRPSVIGDYARAFGPQVLGLTGSNDQIAAAAAAYGVYYQKVPLPETPGEYTMDHTTAVYLMGRTGKLVTILLPDQSADEVAAVLAKVL